MLSYKRSIKFLICFFLLLSIFTPIKTDAFGLTQKSSEIIDTKDYGVFLPVIMYHNILKSSKSRFIASPQQLEDDLIALNKEGYKSVFPSEIISYVKGKGNLPKKPILITFDDGHYNNYHYALPLFKKYNVKGVINIVGAFTKFSTDSGDISNPNYSHLTWEQIEELSKSGHFEIGNHTFNMHKFKPRYGIAQKKGEGVDDYCNAIKKDITELQTFLKTKSHLEPNVFAYPFGKYNKNSEKTIKELGFEMILTCNAGVNLIKRGNADNLFRLKRYNREGNWNSEKLIDVLKKGAENLESQLQSKENKTKSA